MTLIFSASLKQGKTPNDWKEAKVSLIFKKGDKSQPANYRHVSLTSICSKVLEHIIHSHLINFFEDNQILCDQQHGFRKHRSCESQLLTTVQDLASGIENSQQIAFDQAQTLLWSQRNNPSMDKKFPVRQNPEGRHRGQFIMFSPSHLRRATGYSARPLLFLAYINDLPSKVNAKACLFADDCLLYHHIKTDKESLQDDLNKLQDWETGWQIYALQVFNPDKCKLIRITKKRKTISAMYHIHNIQLNQAKRAKYLGITFSNKLSWHARIQEFSSGKVQVNLTQKALTRFFVFF